jgi:hypothetical protein
MTSTYTSEKPAEELEQGWANPAQEEPIQLAEETVDNKQGREKGGLPLSFSTGRLNQLPRSLGEAISEDSPSIRFRIPVAESKGPSGSPLRRSYAVLTQVKSSQSQADWIEAAATLKEEAVRLRQTHHARHSSVLLALADALTFTEPSDPTVDLQAATFDRALALLSEPFLSEPDEEDFLGDLLSHGWNLTPSAGDALLTE